MQIVTREVAKLAKEVGFSMPTNSYYGRLRNGSWVLQTSNNLYDWSKQENYGNYILDKPNEKESFKFGPMYALLQTNQRLSSL